jgi:hypothetical protein
MSMIVQQCEECAKKGKKVYCNRCTLRADYFHVHGYGSGNIDGLLNGNQSELIIKAYTWNDVIEYIKNIFFGNRFRTDLNINCEKDYAYIEEKPDVQVRPDGAINVVNQSGKKNQLGFKVYLIDRDNILESQTFKDRNVYDLTSNNTRADT